ncbi:MULTISPECIES: SUKH-4 family immunity protein [unclassified Streptomyces]|uniref:SUKH-4 family immunity protein n=1 Tax=unclassified Streptomyces TaxID=2593676 RepID=UPI0013685421|nr:MULTISPECIES: SUKH-4 family immunity protein [unclassified Streptomyces]MYT70394.1 hypothetical protein [Streptomyces sp. SID8367]
MSPGERGGDWRFTLGSWSEERLLVLVNSHRAGLTRRSYEPERLLHSTLPLLARGKLAVLTDARPELLPSGAPAEAVFRLAEPTDLAPAPDLPAALRALALAEPRSVPLPVWAELVAAVTGETVAAGELTEVARVHADAVLVGSLGVSFVDEAVAEVLRHQFDSAELTRVNRHMVTWLLRTSADFRHPEGWAKAGAVGLYAATGLAMHAVQAGTYEELLRDGGVVAHLPQASVMDSARSHSFIIPGNSPASDALHLWNWGVVPRSQGEWASWLHLMAWSRDDLALASSVASSGVALPWRVRWARWRLPGGFHARFLEAGRFIRLAEVRRQGRSAVAGLQKRVAGGSTDPYVTIRDVETGELVAGPWEQGEIPQEHGTELTLPTATATAPSASSGAQGSQSPERPTRLAELFGASSPPRDNSAFLLPCAPLLVGDVLVFGGDLGLLAIQAANGVDPSVLSDTFGSRRQPLSWEYSDAGPSTPVDAAPSSHSDLIALFGEEDIFEAEPEELPDELTHQGTRDLFTDFGLPDMDEGGMALLPYGDGEVELFDEVDWPDDVESVADRGPFFQIGTWMGGEIVVDGPTGHILRVPTGPDEEELAGLPAARSLESFLTMVPLWVTGLRTRALLPPGSPERGQITHWVLGALADVDAAGGEQPAWSYVLHNE